ncbi:2,4-dienoyl-CoA reductase [Alloyangia pacifica]|uniref:2,4-dienoyl-CoA reductase n=2 Tax=Alloyangia pacifica TaxID=311180 RepID=A0A1I6UWY4_9RHOB|nr:2,4-dienoyl-CoA reductase [Alloyangia pacifica]SFT05966.1 2,4-dienoyl-CoA reductase [Alloyangia pacifica]
MPGRAYQLYHREKARGGLALTMFGGSSNVDRDSPSIFHQLNLGSDRVIPYLQQFSSLIHDEGAGLMCQITHLGRRGDPYAADRLPTIAPSVVRETLHRSIPKEMDDHDIHRVVSAFAAAALRCKEGGLDGLEVITGSHLLGQFLSPQTNRRTDRFGGTLEKRIHFPLMVFDAIRKAVGDDFLVGIRMTIDEGAEGGIPLEDAIVTAQQLESAGVVDFFNAVYGTTDTPRGMVEENMPTMGSPIAPWVERVGQFKAEVGLPVFHATRISDLASARYAISSGKMDMAAMTRAHIADPHIVKKLMAGQEERIRPCVGATHCQSQNRPACLHNPATGREGMMDHAIPRTTGPAKSALVVGGGPAGLEAARVLAERGHKVELHEAASELGGQLMLGMRSWRKDLNGIIDWRVAELERMGVPIHTNSYLDAEDILAKTPDVVVLATGGIPLVDMEAGADLCTTPWDLLTGQVQPARRVLVYDGTGRHGAPLVAELAAGQGAEVQLACLDPVVGEELTYAERFRWKKRLMQLGITPIPELRLLSVERHGNALRAIFRSEIVSEPVIIDADQVIVEQGTIPLDDPFATLRPMSANDGQIDLEAFVALKDQPVVSDGRPLVYRIGDAVASRNVHSAIYDALRMCLNI